MSSVYFSLDLYIQNIDIEPKIQIFFDKIKHVFGGCIIDEVFIFKFENNEFIPIYFYSLDSKLDLDKNNKKLEKIKQEKINNLSFFVEEIIKKDALLDQEGLIVGNHKGGLFDIILRMENYYIAFNNSEESFNSLKEKFGVTTEAIMSMIKEFYSNLRKK